MALRNTLSNKRERLDLRELQALQGARIHTARAGKVDHDIDIGVLRARLLEAGVHGQQRLLRSPVEFLDVVPAEGVDHGGDGGCGATA